MKQPILLNLTFPFISRKPSFCTDNLIEGHNTAMLRDYVVALAMELKSNAEDFKDCQIQAIRMDGGSASITDGSDIDRLFRFLRNSYDIAENVPISMRTCPADINGANVPFYNRVKISRYDLEMYSLEPQDFIYLDTLNYKEQLPYISKGFIHADKRNSMGFILLYGKKTISKYGFRRSVLETIRRPVCHVIFQRCQGDDCMSDEEAQAQLDMAGELLTDAGYKEYLPLHWAKEGAEDAFLVGKANGMNILGVGLGAQTRLDGLVSTNTTDLELYLRNSGNYEAITASVVQA